MSKLIVGVSGSVGPGGRTTALVRLGLARASALGFEPRLIDLQSDGIEWCDGREPSAYEGATREAITAVEDCSACLIGSPAYRAAYSGRLKNFLDILPADALRGIPVCLLGTGGSGDHSLFLDYALRAVMAQFRCLVVGTLYTTPQEYGSTGFIPAVEQRLEAVVSDVCRLASDRASA